MEEIQVTTIDENGLSILDEREAGLIKLANEYKGLTIAGVEDKIGYQKLSEARKLLKSERVKLQNDAFELREGAVKFQKTIIRREKELVAIVEPTEKELWFEETRIDDEIEKIKAEKDKIKADKINNRIKALNDLRYAVDIQIITNMSDEKFEDVMSEARTEFDKSEAIRIEEEKKQDEIKKQEEARQIELRKKEEEKLEEERKEIERLKADQEIRQKEMDDHNLRLKEEQEAKQKVFEEEQKLFREEQEAKEKELKARQVELYRLEEERLAKIKSEAEAKAAKERTKQEEKLRKEKEEKDKKELLLYGQDSDRFSELFKILDDHILHSELFTTMKSEQGKKIVSDVESMLYQAAMLCKTNSKEIEACRTLPE